MEQTLKTSQTQKLLLTPYLHVIMEILQLPLIDLEQRINQELIENPVIELDDNITSSLTEDTTDIFNEIELSRTEELFKYFESSSDLGTYNYYAKDIDREKKLNILESGLSYKFTLQEHLLWQLRINLESEEDFKIGETIISYIDDKGYLTSPIEEISNILNVPVEKVEKVLNVIQTFEPYGVGARNLQECLLIQLKLSDLNDELPFIIVKDYFNELSKHNYEKISKSLGVNIDKIKKAVSIIKKLNPFPGIQFDSKDSGYIIPDVIVTKINDKFLIKLNDDYIPRLRINKEYEKMIKSDKIPAETKKYIIEKYNKAVWFLKGIEQRRISIYRIAEAILEFQKDFFEKGIKYIKPLKLKDLSERLKMHPSSISRIASNKYIQTQWGVFKLKYFFSYSIKAMDDTDVSSKKILDLIMEYIKNENKKKPYTDAQLVNLLKKDGILISRRTITKYRMKLNILPSHLRKEK